jgi:hypothetical protein
VCVLLAEEHQDLLNLAPDSWVAIGTILLALATGGLGFLTWQLGRASRRDVEAQWRPVLVPSDRVGMDPGWNLAVSDSEDGSKRIGWINVINAGSGPALELKFYVDAPHRMTTDTWGALASNDKRYFEFELPPGTTEASCRFEYQSISGNVYPSKFLIEAMPAGPRWRIADVLVHGEKAFK